MGCDSTAIVIIAKEDLSIVVSTKEASCAAGAKDGGASVTSPVGLDYTYVWSNGQTGPVLKDVAEGSYKVTVSNTKTGCTKVQDVNVPKRVLPAPQFSIISALCESKTGSATIVSPIGTGSKYEWEGGKTGVSITDVVAGSYSVTITDKDGCTSKGTAVIPKTPPPFTVTVNPNLQTIAPGTPIDVTVSITPPNAAVTLSWNPPTATPVAGKTNVYTIVPKTETSFTVTATGTNECSNKASLTITYKEPIFKIPSVFTPDDDKNPGNQVLQPFEDEAKNYNQYSVFNRWGERVYHVEGTISVNQMKGLAETAAPNTPVNPSQSKFWNGSYDNLSKKQCPTDVYILIIKYTDKNGAAKEARSQDVTLLR
jgi:hypothetical protein